MLSWLTIISLVCVIGLISISMYYCCKNSENYTNKKVDFVTIVYDDQTELNLLRLQASSFKMVDPQLINNIMVVFNDKNGDRFKQSFKKDFLPYYPKNLRDRVKVITLKQMNLNMPSSWRSQQIIKLQISKLVTADYYVILDGKNHFIKRVNYNTFFKGGKPVLFSHNPGTMIRYYYSCLDYFGAECPFNYKYNERNEKYEGDNILLTTTPYLFCVKDVKELIRFIEKKEKTPFTEFFLNNKNITEFYLYSTYLIYTDKIKKYSISPKMYKVIFPKTEANHIEKILKESMSNPTIKCLGLHRRVIKNNLSNKHKQKLLTLYASVYDKKTMKFIRGKILY